MLHVYLKKNVYPHAGFKWSILYVSFRSSLLIVLFKSSISLLFCLVVLPIVESRIWKYPTTIIELSISLFNSGDFCFMYFGALLSGEYTFIVLISA